MVAQKDGIMRYRDHRGGLSESMSTQIEIISIDHLKLHLNKSWAFFYKEVDDIKFEYCGYDERIGWDTYYVLQRLKGESNFTVAGMSDGKLS